MVARCQAPGTGATAELSRALLETLRANPAGLSEYELIRVLAARGLSMFAGRSFSEPLALFRMHFVLFHTLYRLQACLAVDRQSRLEISPLRIRLLPPKVADDNALGEHDVVRDYYLDIRNLEQTKAADLGSMLNEFWSRFVGAGARAEALAVLGLRDPVDDGTVRREYRRLTMRNHPDRGGDKERLQAINAAMMVLARRPTK